MSATELLALVFLAVGLLVATLAVWGLLRLPDLYLRLHAASKAVFLGVAAIVLAAWLAAGADFAGRALLIVLFLTVSTPASSHAIAWAASKRRG